jgi:hypothetical protein
MALQPDPSESRRLIGDNTSESVTLSIGVKNLRLLQGLLYQLSTVNYQLRGRALLAPPLPQVNCQLSTYCVTL